MIVILKFRSFSQISYVGAEPELSQTSKLKSFVTIVNSQTLLANVVILLALDIMRMSWLRLCLFK